MKHWTRMLLLASLAVLCMACASANRAELRAGDSPSKVSTSSAVDRQILITFPDERQTQVSIADAANGYRQRGSYQNSTWSLRLAEQFAKEYGLKALIQWPIDALGIHCVVFEIPANISLEQTLQRLAQDKRIEAVQSMKTFHVMGSAYSDPYFKLQTGLRNMNLSAAHQIATGRNIKIAVIDTGVDVRHPDLTGQLSPGQNFVEQFPEAPDEVHGTAVAGVIAAASNNAQGIVGVAPGAKLIALRACWPVGPQKPEAQCDSLTLSLALNGAIKLKPQIINLSLSGPSDPLVERLVNKAMDEGIIVVASSRSGGLAQENFPASIRRVIAVQTATAGEAKLSVDADAIAAPGQEILTTLPNNSYNFMSGSSFAAAHVSGLIALMLELKPGLNAAQIASLLLGSMSSEPSLQALRTVNCCTALASVGPSHCELPFNDGQAAKSSIKPMLN